MSRLFVDFRRRKYLDWNFGNFFVRRDEFRLKRESGISNYERINANLKNSVDFSVSKRSKTCNYTALPCG